MRLLLSLALAAAVSVGPGCIRNSSRRGIEPVWMELDPASFVVGTTTRADVLARVGVPSQVLALEDGTALYYLLERSRADGLILLLYNQRVESSYFDRAIFFFDDAGVLTEFAVSEGAGAR